MRNISDYEKLFELMHQRQSIRKFQKKEIPKKIIEKIVSAGTTAPSSFNSQPWKFYVIQNAEKKNQIRELYEMVRKKKGWYKQDVSFIENATPIIVTCEDDAHGKIISCGMAIQNMFLAAESLGLGSLPAGTLVTDEETVSQVKKICEISKEEKIILGTFFGYKDETPERKERKDLNSILEFK
ncbi:MAG: nitroreductase [Candidatus Diapherotrites archaeon]